MEYLFYDLETTGLNKAFDQVLQFAAIRTDEAFNEIDRTELLVKLNPDVLPSPGASITHRISLASLAKGISEYDAIRKIHHLLNQPNTISLGYNTLGFDDEFLRFSFYRNLLTPYTHQFANGCHRMDLYPITVLYYLFAPDSLHWPERNSKVSLKLENLSEANHLAAGPAHQAIVDVEATLALARHLKAHKEMWTYTCGFFSKVKDQQRIQQLPPAFKQLDARFKQGLCIQGSIGAKNQFQAPVLFLGQHQHYKNQTLWLRLDQETIQGKPEASFVIRKRFAEPPFILPPEPRFLEKIDSERLRLAERNLAYLEAHPRKLEHLCEYFQHYKYPDVPNVDVDALLYQRGFPTSHDLSQFCEFHRATDKLSIANNFNDSLYQEQAYRIIGRHFPEQLSAEAHESFALYLEQLGRDKAVVDYRNQPHLTPAALRRDVEELTQHPLDEEQKHLLQELLELISTHP